MPEAASARTPTIKHTIGNAMKSSSPVYAVSQNVSAPGDHPDAPEHAERSYKYLHCFHKHPEARPTRP